MDPEIEDSSVVLGKTFDFSITFSCAGDDCYATRLGILAQVTGGEAYKNGKWENHSLPADGFSKGVLAGPSVGNLAGYEDKALRELCRACNGVCQRITSTVTITLSAFLYPEIPRR